MDYKGMIRLICGLEQLCTVETIKICMSLSPMNPQPWELLNYSILQSCRIVCINYVGPLD